MEKLIIADAGGTKTEWLIADILDGDSQKFTTGSINASVSSDQEVEESILEFKKSLNPNYIDAATRIYFYGAGCNSKFTIERIKARLSAILSILPNNILVESDIKGAAIGLFGMADGIACVLGTGSASSLFLKGEIIDSVPSLGYILGDEGSGAFLGKELINRYFKRSLPEKISIKFEEEFNLEISEVIHNVYRSASPAKYLGSFLPFIIRYKDQYIELKKLAKDGINEFFKRNINRYSDASSYSLGFVGSTAFYLSDIIEEVAAENNFQSIKFLRSPLDDIYRNIVKYDLYEI